MKTCSPRSSKSLAYGLTIMAALCTAFTANSVSAQYYGGLSLGPLILERLKGGRSPEAILGDLEASDPDLKWRQLAIMTADGKGAFFNGARILSIAKGKVGRDCVAVGNILRTTGVVDAMVTAFEETGDQPLAERLMRAIEAGDAAGGELKQLKSAGLLVVHKENFPFVDLRVDLNAQPLVELRFLWELYQPSADSYVVRAIDPDRAPNPG